MNNSVTQMNLLDGEQGNKTALVSGNPLELKIIFYAGFVIGLPLTLLGNSLVIVAIALNRKLRTCTNALLVSLALADLPVGLVVFPLIAITQKYGPLLKHGLLICHSNIFVTELFLSASCLHLVFVSVDRYIAINNPLRYKELVTGKRVGYVILFIWSASLLVSILPFLGWREVRPRKTGGYCQYHLNLSKSYILFLHSIVCVTPLVITCCAYCKIFQIAKQQAQKIAAMTVGGTDKTKRHQALDRDRKITLIVAMVVGLFIVCWGPINIMLLVYISCEHCVTSHAIEAAEVFALMNSACNPLIYGIFNKRFRCAFKLILMCRFGQADRDVFDDLTSFHPEATRK